jgi:ribosomal protein L23
MRDLYDVIIAPVMTEKATEATEDRNVYTFVVHPRPTRRRSPPRWRRPGM